MHKHLMWMSKLIWPSQESNTCSKVTLRIKPVPCKPGGLADMFQSCTTALNKLGGARCFKI